MQVLIRQVVFIKFVILSASEESCVMGNEILRWRSE
jgi:hypothetical protein